MTVQLGQSNNPNQIASQSAAVKVNGQAYAWDTENPLITIHTYTERKGDRHLFKVPPTV